MKTPFALSLSFWLLTSSFAAPAPDAPVPANDSKNVATNLERQEKSAKEGKNSGARKPPLRANTSRNKTAQPKDKLLPPADGVLDLGCIKSE